MANLLNTNELYLRKAFVVFAVAKGYDAEIVEDSVVIRNVNNHNNNFRIVRVDNYYVVYTICISPDDYEYSAKCMVYILLAEYNRSNIDNTHLHMNFRVDL